MSNKIKYPLLIKEVDGVKIEQNRSKSVVKYTAYTQTSVVGYISYGFSEIEKMDEAIEYVKDKAHSMVINKLKRSG